MSKLYILTVATDPVCYFPYLKESVEKNGGQLIVLGFGEKWQGFTWKYSLVLEQLKKLNDYDIVCFVDGYDVICTRHLSKLKDDFVKIKEREGCKMIGGHQKVINDKFTQKINEYYIHYYFGRCNNLQLNSGTYIGYAKDIQYILKNINNLNIEDDQILLTNYCNKNKNDIYIDIHNELFLTISNGYTELDQYIRFSNDKISYQNNNNPYFLHACGEGYLDNVILRLGYDMKKKVKNEIQKKRYKKIFKEIENFFKKNVIYLLLFIFVIIIVYILYKLYFRKKINRRL
jgi:hypothetical protein